MKWIDDMFQTMDKARDVESAHRRVGGNGTVAKEPARQRIPGALDAWKSLVTAISNDVNYFNSSQRRSGHTAVAIAQRRFECEVYVPGMLSKRMVLTLEGNDLSVSVHPDFPDQQLTITIEPDPDGKHSFWVLGEPAKETKKLTAQQLSEYLLRPILSTAEIN
jgi:hypothetical protein